MNCTETNKCVNKFDAVSFCVRDIYGDQLLCDLVVRKWTIQRAGIVDWALKRPLTVYSDGIS